MICADLCFITQDNLLAFLRKFSAKYSYRATYLGLGLNITIRNIENEISAFDSILKLLQLEVRLLPLMGLLCDLYILMFSLTMKSTRIRKQYYNINLVLNSLTLDRYYLCFKIFTLDQNL